MYSVFLCMFGLGLECAYEIVKSQQHMRLFCLVFMRNGLLFSSLAPCVSHNGSWLWPDDPSFSMTPRLSLYSVPYSICRGNDPPLWGCLDSSLTLWFFTTFDFTFRNYISHINSFRHMSEFIVCLFFLLTYCMWWGVVCAPAGHP